MERDFGAFFRGGLSRILEVGVNGMLSEPLEVTAATVRRLTVLLSGAVAALSFLLPGERLLLVLTMVAKSLHFVARVRIW